MEEMLLSRKELDGIENDPIFSMWLFGNVDENNLSENQKRIIIARQMYYDLLLPDEYVIHVIKHLKCRSYSELINDSNLIESASMFLGVRKDVLITKVTLMKKRFDRQKTKADEMKLNLNKRNS